MIFIKVTKSTYPPVTQFRAADKTWAIPSTEHLLTRTKGSKILITDHDEDQILSLEGCGINAITCDGNVCWHLYIGLRV